MDLTTFKMTHFPIERMVTRAWIQTLERTQGDVLINQVQVRQRSVKLHQALSLSLSNHGEVVFWIENGDYCMPLKSRALALGDRSVFLEHNVRIPINNICHIQFLS